MCKFVSVIVPAFPHQASGTWKMESQCIEHDMVVTTMVGTYLPPDALCPIGRIEKARDEALAAIAAARA